MAEADSMASTLIWVGIGVGIVLVLGGAGLIYWCYKYGNDDNNQGGLLDNLLRREQLEDTFMEDENNGWQCVVCAYMNNSKRKTCLMCGTSTDFLVSNRTLLRHKSSLTILLKSNDANANPDAEEEGLRARQRALTKRHMNTILRKNLSQRQRGAYRRRLWERKQAEDGKFHWIRQNSTDANGQMFRDNNTYNPPMIGKDLNTAGPNGENMVDFHNFRSQGFVSHYNELGRLTWKKAEDVSIDMESFDQMQNALLKDETMDFEGIMAMDFRHKKQWFLVHLSRLATPVTEAVSKLVVNRENLMEESLQRVTKSSPEVLHTYLKITFAGEPGIDAGGLLREWFGIVCKEVFSEKLGLFVPTKGEDMSYWINPLSGEKNERHLQYFRFAGILIGKALFEGLVLDVHLALPLMKHILGIPISFSDLEFLDEELHRNCQWLRTNNQVENLCLTFSVMMENGEEVDLKPNGRNIDVTDENKDEYLRLILEHRMLESISDQLQELLTGIYDVVPKGLLSVFDYQELELMLCGIPTIDTTDWRQNTKIRYIPDDDEKKNPPITVAMQDAVLQWFWIVIEGMSPEGRARLLQFTTGTSRVPVEGFKGLMSSSGIIHPFTIQLVRRDKDSANLFPKAHTCFNRLDLPMYRNMEELETYLTMVSQMEIFGFGLE